MAQQKAKLGILDIPLDKDFALEPPPPPDSGGDPKPEKVKRPWYRNRWVIAGGIGTGFLGILAAAVLFVWNPAERSRPPRAAVCSSVRNPRRGLRGGVPGRGVLRRREGCLGITAPGGG